MDHVWTPWRYQYLKQAESGQQPDCFFCDAVQRTDDTLKRAQLTVRAQR